MCEGTRPNGKRTVWGELPTRVVRVPTGNVPMDVVAGFPNALRVHGGQAGEHYRNGILLSGAPDL